MPRRCFGEILRPGLANDEYLKRSIDTMDMHVFHRRTNTLLLICMAVRRVLIARVSRSVADGTIGLSTPVQRSTLLIIRGRRLCFHIVSYINGTASSCLYLSNGCTSRTYPCNSAIFRCEGHVRRPLNIRVDRASASSFRSPWLGLVGDRRTGLEI